MDEDTKLIKDPQRVLWYDEMPQQLDYAPNGRSQKAYGTRGQPLASGNSVERESVSINICCGLDGWTYGPQFIIPRKNLNRDQCRWLDPDNPDDSGTSNRH